MTGGPEARPAFSLSFDPRTLTDLLQAPGDIRDLALALLHDVVNARLFGGRLTHDLDGCRKLYVDHRKAWRIVYIQRPVLANFTHRAEIHVVAVRPRANHEVYDTVRARLGIAHAAPAPQLDTPHQPIPKPALRPYPMPACPGPAPMNAPDPSRGHSQARAPASNTGRRFALHRLSRLLEQPCLSTTGPAQPTAGGPHVPRALLRLCPSCVPTASPYAHSRPGTHGVRQ